MEVSKVMVTLESTQQYIRNSLVRKGELRNISSKQALEKVFWTMGMMP